MSLIFSNLVAYKTFSHNIIAMHNVIAKFRKILKSASNMQEIK